MSTIDEKRPTPNFWFCYAAVMGAFAWHVWPEEGAYFGTYVLASFLTLLALGGFLKAISNLQRDYSRRKIYASASRASGIFGAARYASMEEIRSVGVYKKDGTLIVGSSYNRPAFLPRQYSLACQAPPKAGKTSCLVSKAVFHAVQTGRSAIVSDCKPELVYLWAQPLRERGFNVVINNPGLLKGFEHDNSNPFEPIKEAVADPRAQGEVFTMAESLARALMPDIKGDKNQYFRDLDRNAFVLILICLAGFEPQNCYPAQLWKALADPRRFKELSRKAVENDALEGDLAALAANFLAKEKDSPEHFNGALTGAANSLSIFKPSSTLGMVGASHEFDPKSLRDENRAPTIIFDVFPADRLNVFANANALMQTSRLQALKRCREGRDIVFICDEAVNLPVPTVIEEIELARSFGITMCLFYQSGSSLKRVYGEDRAESIRASCIEIYFSVSDLKTAEEISKRSGEYTVKTHSQSFDEFGKPSQNIGEAKQAFLPVDEVLALPPDQALMFVPGIRPVKLTKLPWFEVEPFKSLAGDNPHERHPKSSITRMTLDYGKDASELRPPVVPDIDERLARHERREAARNKIPRVPFLPLRSLLWIPIVVAVAAVIFAIGTPHALFSYEIRNNPNERHDCIYVGLSGFRPLSVQGKCPALKLVRHQREALS
jgi:type IV secretion system protein VirD4